MGMIRCETHGLTPLIMTSPDLAALVKKRLRDAEAEIFSVLYVYLGTVAMAFYPSKDFADAHSLRACVGPLPDELDEWSRETVPCCARCFERAFGGEFGNDHQWRRAR